MKLSQDQQDAVDKMIQFIASKDKFMNLSGMAGTGKTHVIKHFINDVIAPTHAYQSVSNTSKLFKHIVLLASTNKAAAVLGTHNPDFYVETIHKFFNLVLQRDFNTGRLELKRKHNCEIVEDALIIIDEASMIERDLFRQIDELTHNCKIIFISDQWQLGPIGNSSSVIYNMGYPIADLKQLMRTTNPHLEQLYQMLRANVGKLKPVTIPLLPGVVEHYPSQSAKDIVKQAFSQPNYDARIVAYTNERVLQWTQFINDEVLNRGSEVAPNTRMILGSRFICEGRSYYPEEEVEILAIQDPKYSIIFTYMDDYDEVTEIQGRKAKILFREHIKPHTASNVPVDMDPRLIKQVTQTARKKHRWNDLDYVENHLIDLRHREVATVHKTQGSTYDDIYVDLSNLSTCRSISTFYRLLYVACSRARNKVILLGSLDPKFGKIV